MRVVFLGTRGFPDVQGGVEKHCEYLTTNLVKLNVEVIVFTRIPYIDTELKFYKGVKLVPLITFKNKYFEALLHTFIGIFAARKYKPDLLHIQGIGPALFIPLAKLLGIKVVVTSHGSNYKHLKWGRFTSLFLKLCEYIGMKSANSIIAVSNSIANEIKNKYKRTAALIPNGVQKPQFSRTTLIIDKYKLNRRKYILSVGRFVPEKGFHYLIDACNILEGFGWKLVISGDADHESKYSVDLKNKANKNIIFTGYISGKVLEELYSHAGLFVLPSFYEGLPIVLLEAMSYGLSCVVSDIEANRNFNLNNNRYFEPGNIEELKTTIIKYINNPLTTVEKRNQIEMIENHYGWENIALSTFHIYQNLLS